MKTALLFIFAAAFLAITAPVFAQGVRLSEADYNTALAKALEAASARDRRVVTTEKFYSGAELKGTRRIVSEFAGPDAKKVEVAEDFGGSSTKKDSVKLGDQFFCRDGNKGWKRSGNDCSGTGQLAIPDGDYEYLVETDSNDPSRKIYTRRAAFADSSPGKKRDDARMKSIEIKFTAGENGILEYTETRRGGIEPEGWSSTQITTYEYEPKDLRISDPTRETP